MPANQISFVSLRALFHDYRLVITSEAFSAEAVVGLISFCPRSYWVRLPMAEIALVRFVEARIAFLDANVSVGTDVGSQTFEKLSGDASKTILAKLTHMKGIAIDACTELIERVGKSVMLDSDKSSVIEAVRGKVDQEAVEPGHHLEEPAARRSDHLFQRWHPTDLLPHGRLRAVRNARAAQPSLPTRTHGHPRRLQQHVSGPALLRRFGVRSDDSLAATLAADSPFPFAASNQFGSPTPAREKTLGGCQKYTDGGESKALAQVGHADVPSVVDKMVVRMQKQINGTQTTVETDVGMGQSLAIDVCSAVNKKKSNAKAAALTASRAAAVMKRPVASKERSADIGQRPPLAFPGVRVQAPKRFKGSTLYVHADKKAYRVVLTPGVEKCASFKTRSPQEAWAIVVDAIREFYKSI